MQWVSLLEVPKPDYKVSLLQDPKPAGFLNYIIILNASLICKIKYINYIADQMMSLMELD
jgi:hypothetical protein